MEADRVGTATALAARTGNIRDANDFPRVRKRGRAALAPARHAGARAMRHALAEPFRLGKVFGVMPKTVTHKVDCEVFCGNNL